MFLTRINLSPEVATNAVLASVTLHNLLRTMSSDTYSPPEMIDEDIDFQTVRPGLWREDGSSNLFLSLPSGRQNNRYVKNAEEIRSFLADYFYGRGQAPWQWGNLV